MTKSSTGPVFDTECDVTASRDSNNAGNSNDVNALYSEEFQTLLRVDAMSGTRNFHPVYVLGYSAEMVRVMRDSYRDEEESELHARHPVYTVKLYGLFENIDLANRIGIPPSVIVLAPHVDLDGDVRAFVKMHRLPVLRVQLQQTDLVELPCRDYYGGIYETIAESDITNRTLWTRAINIGLLVWLRTRGLRGNDTLVSLRDTKAMRRQFVPKPAPSFSAFASSQLQAHGIDEAAQTEFIKALPPESVLNFRSQESEHEDAQITTYLESRKLRKQDSSTLPHQLPELPPPHDPHPLFG